MFDSISGSDNGTAPSQTTFSVEDWHGSTSRQADPFQILLAVGNDAAAAAAVSVTGWIARRQQLHPLAVHILDIDDLSSPERHGGDAASQSPPSAADVYAAQASDLAGTIRTLGGLPTRWPLDVRLGPVGAGILQCAREHRADLVVLGRHRTTPRAAIGPRSAADSVDIPRLLIESERVPVLAVHADQAELPKRAVVAVDFHRASLCAARLACQLVDPGGVVYLVHVRPSLSVAASSAPSTTAKPSAETPARGVTAAFAHLTHLLQPDNGVTLRTILLLGDPAVELTSFVEHTKPDLVALGTRGTRRPTYSGVGPLVQAMLKPSVVGSILVVPPASESPWAAE